MDTLSPSRRRALRLVGALAVLALAGCGRKADPKPPPDADPYAPRSYPVDRTRRDEDADPTLRPPPPAEPLSPLPPTTTTPTLPFPR